VRTLSHFIAVLVAVSSQAVVSESLPDTIAKVRPSVVSVGTARPARRPLAKRPPAVFHGTGFVVGNGLQIITNDHVVPVDLDTDNNETIAIFTGRGKDTRVRAAMLVRSDPEHDLALLSIQGAPLPAMTLGEAGRVREGQNIAFTGFPIGMVLGLYPVSHRGIVSAITPTVIPAQNARTLTPAQLKRMRNPFLVYQLDATAYPGNSGSPVYEPGSGLVIGVVNSVFVKETKEAVLEKPSGITYAIPVEFVHRLLEGARPAE
jgi:S1-C subfamily serine protease